MAADHDSDWLALLDAMRDSLPEITRATVARVVDELPFYRDIPPDQLEEAFASDFRRAYSSIREERPLTPSERAESERIGQERARQGIPNDAMLGAWRIGLETATAHAAALAASMALSDALVLRLTRSAWAWGGVSMVNEGRAHRQTELELVRNERDLRGTFVRSVVEGSLELAVLRQRADTFGLDPDRPYLALYARPAADTTHRQLELALDLATKPHPRGLVTLVKDDLVGFLTLIPARLPGTIGVGPPGPLHAIAESATLARRALSTAITFRLSGTWDLPRLGLYAAVAADPELGDLFAHRYLDPFRHAGTHGQAVLIAVREYLVGGMRIKTTASRIHLHPNSLRHRLKRFEEQTGANLHDPGGIAQVWWALLRESVLTGDMAWLPSEPPRPA